LVSVPSPSSRTGRLTALMMPVVTVPASPSGEPIAITASPTRSPADLPREATVGLATSTLITARSVFGSRPTMRPATLVWSKKTTSSLASALLAASDTTWLFVTT
jgi:hypothetical protein